MLNTDAFEKIRETEHGLVICCIYLRLTDNENTADRINMELADFQRFADENDIIAAFPYIDVGDSTECIDRIVAEIAEEYGAPYSVVLYKGENAVLENYPEYRWKFETVAIRIDNI